MGSTTFVPDFTIVGGSPTTQTEQGVGPAQNVWPPEGQAPAIPSPVVPNPTWSQAAWFVDPSNSTGNANDLNAGTSALAPVLSYNGGIVAKWGTNAPTLRQDTTITWLSSQPSGALNADPVICYAVMINAILTFKGNLDATTQVHAGTFGAVTAKDRATGQLLNVDLGFAAAIGTLIHNTTHDSWAWVYASVAGTTFAITQPLTRLALPMTEFTPPSSVDTWAIGNTFVAYAPTSVWVSKIACQNAEQQAATGFPCAAQMEALTLVSADGVTSDCDTCLNQVSRQFTHDLAYVEEEPATPYDITQIINNCFKEAGANSRQTSVTLFNGGALLSIGGIGPVVTWTFDFDAIIDATGDTIVIGSPDLGEGATGTGLSFAYVTGTIAMIGNVGLAASLTGGAVWGPGTLDARGAAHIVYEAGTAVARLLNSGGITLNALTTASSYQPSTGVWTGNITITPTHLDDGTFVDGKAINPGGASISTTANL